MCPDDSRRLPSVESQPTREADDHLPGEDVGPYHLLQKIGEGGMGEVWIAEQHKPIRRTVALKLIKAGMHACDCSRACAKECSTPTRKGLSTATSNLRTFSLQFRTNSRCRRSSTSGSPRRRRSE